MGVKDEFLGNEVLLYIDTVTPVDTPIEDIDIADAVLVACLVNNGFDGTNSPISTTSKCSGKFATSIGGEQGWTMTADGNSVHIETGEAATLKSHNALFKLWKSGLPFWAYMYDTALKTVRWGVVRIDSDGEAFPTNAAATFTISLTGIGEPYDQDDLPTP